MLGASWPGERVPTSAFRIPVLSPPQGRYTSPRAALQAFAEQELARVDTISRGSISHAVGASPPDVAALLVFEELAHMTRVSPRGVCVWGVGGGGGGGGVLRSRRVRTPACVSARRFARLDCSTSSYWSLRGTWQHHRRLPCVHRRPIHCVGSGPLRQLL